MNKIYITNYEFETMRIKIVKLQKLIDEVADLQIEIRNLRKEKDLLQSYLMELINLIQDGSRVND